MMAVRALNLAARHIFAGNLLLIACCALYFVWWLLAFRPSGGIRGMKMGWLLLPTLALGIAAVVLTVLGISGVSMVRPVFSGYWILWGGVAACLILLAITLLKFHRPVTTELFLIVGWAVLMLSEIHALYGGGQFSGRRTVILTVATGAAAVISMICYMRYYHLPECTGYVDEMIPLFLTVLVASVLSAALFI
jgi:hypothetical protein